MKGGKTVAAKRAAIDSRLASMRPAREGRENPPRAPSRQAEAVASMRPAREGRENAENAKLRKQVEQLQ